MTDTPTADLLALARTDLAVYSTALRPRLEFPPHLEVLAGRLEAVAEGEQRRLSVAMPPRHGKSTLTSEVFVAWYLGRFPDRQVIFATYAADFAEDFGRRVRNLLADPFHRAIFPKCRLSDDSSGASKFATTAGGIYIATGRGGQLVGRGADLLLIDDPLKNREEAMSPGIRRSLHEWFRTDAFTRLEPDGAAIVISTRWHLDDLTGMLLREHPEERWEVLSFPAIAEKDDPLGRKEGEALWPERYPIEELARIRAVLGSQSWLALYQGRPVPEGGAIFKAEWFAEYDSLPKFQRVIQAWDTAYGKGGSSDDYSACVTVGEAENGFYVLNVTRGRWPFPELRRRMIALAEEFNPASIVVEDAGAGTSLLQELRGKTSLPFLAVKADTSKELRAQIVSPLCEAGRVFLPARAPWRAAFVEELLSFPAGAHDDMVDAFVHGLTRAKRRTFDMVRYGELVKEQAAARGAETRATPRNESKLVTLCPKVV